MDVLWYGDALPEGDRISLARDKIYADLRVACGGRIAEEFVFGDDKVTTGASSDIRMATDMARRMVTEWGMSDKLGFWLTVRMSKKFLGRSVSQKNMADPPRLSLTLKCAVLSMRPMMPRPKS